MTSVPTYVQQLIMDVAPTPRISNAQAQATSQASDAMIKFSNDIYERDVKIQEARALTTMKTELSRQYDESMNDPARLEQMQRSYKDGFIQGIKSPALAEQFSLMYDSEASALLAKAATARKQIQDQEHETAILGLIHSSIESGARYYENVLSDVPEYVIGAERALGANAITFDEMINAKNSDGTYMFTPNQKVMYKKMLDDGIQKRAEAIRNAQIEDENLKATDFAEWADRKGYSPQQIAQMSPDNVIGSSRAKDYAEALGAANVDQMAQIAGELQSQYGEHTNQAMWRITSGMNPDKAAAFNLMLKGGYNEQIRLLNDVAGIKDSDLDAEYRQTMMEGDLGKVPDMESVVFSDNEVARNAAAMRDEGDGAGAYSYQNQLARLAKIYRLRNPSKTPEEAVKFANQYTLDNYNFGRLNGADYRIPTNLPDGRTIDKDMAGVIEERVDSAIKALDMKALGKNIYQRDSIIAVLSPDKSGLMFKDSETNTLVLDSSGTPTELKFDAVLKSYSNERLGEIKGKRLGRAQKALLKEGMKGSVK